VQFSNSIGPDGMSAVADALKKTTRLKDLGLVNAHFELFDFICVAWMGNQCFCNPEMK
jgi:hypothetical protein